MNNLKDKIKLSQSEKADMRQNLVRFMTEHPIGERESGLIRHIWQRTLNRRKKYMPIALIASMIMALSGGVSYAAENSLPGDPFYPVKIHVNEKISAAFANSTEAKAHWNFKVAERRLSEMNQLEAKGELNQEVLSHLETRFDAHADRMESNIERLESKGKHEQAQRLDTNLQAAFQAHEEILARLQAKIDAGETEISKDEMKEIMEDVHGEAGLKGKGRFKIKMHGNGDVNEGADAEVKSETEVEAESNVDLNLGL